MVHLCSAKTKQTTKVL